MIGDRVRWAHTFDDPEQARAFEPRGGVVRAVSIGLDRQWHVLVQHDDGTYADEIASNLAAVGPGSPSDVVERDLAEACAELEKCCDAIAKLANHIDGEGLADNVFSRADGPCGAAIDLLKTFQAELLAVGSARDTADRAAAELAIERDQMREARDAAVAELEATKKRKPRGAGRLPEHES